MYASICPIAQASIGQHIRHSMDHIERAVLTVDDPKLIPRIYYDIRERGCLYETDINESRKLVIDVTNVFKVLYRDVDCIYDDKDEDEVIAYFKSLDMSTVGLHSAIGRELGFSAHHAIL